MSSRTIGGVFDPSRNSLNAIRLALAAAVIVSHSWILTGRGSPPMLGGTDLGLVAVAGFFTISGYLVTASRLRARSLLSYLWRRFLRIYPAFLAALVMVALVFAPLSTLFDASGEIEWPSALGYIVSNAGLFMRQFVIENTLSNNAFPFIWNLPLWTLFYEALCYLLIGVVVSLVPRRALGPALVALLAVCTAVSLVFRLAPHAPPLPMLDDLVSLGSFFSAGALLFVYGHRMPAAWSIALVALAASGLLAALGVFRPLAALPVAYLALFAGSVLPLQRVGRTNDVSYGMYIYGFPVQQTLVLLLGGAKPPVWIFALLAVMLTVPFAWASWLAVEKPSLRLRRMRWRMRWPTGTRGSEKEPAR